MKKFLVLAMVFAMSAAVSANLTVTFSDVDSITDGTGFIASVNGGSDFETFCIEQLETNYPNTTDTFIGFISDEIQVGNDKFGAEDPDLVDDATKKIYSAYLNGALTSAFDVQNAIWGIELAPGNDTTHSLLAGLSASDIQGWTNVRALNLYDTDVPPKAIQSVLIRVPAPGAILLAGVGTSLVGFIRRRSL